MPSRTYTCAKCKKTSVIVWKEGAHPRCKCGSQNLLKVKLGGGTTTPPTPTVKPVATKPPAKPVIPTPPPISGFKPSPVKAPTPNAPSLLQQIQASKVGKFDPETGGRYADKSAADSAAYHRFWKIARDDLPPEAVVVAGSQEQVKEFVRCVVNNCAAKSIPNRTLDVFYAGSRWLFGRRITVDLQLPLADMAAGKCYPSEHANANTTFTNVQRALPTRVNGQSVTYLEYGWRLRVPRLLMKTSWPRDRTKPGIDYVDVVDENGNDAPFGIKTGLARRINNDGGTAEAGLRLVVSDWGHLFFTDSHYRSFMIYDPEHEKWVDYGTSHSADVSWYNKGAPNKNWILPPSARGYY